MNKKANKPVELGKFSGHQLKKADRNKVLTGTNMAGAPGDNYSSFDTGQRKYVKRAE